VIVLPKFRFSARQIVFVISIPLIRNFPLDRKTARSIPLAGHSCASPFFPEILPETWTEAREQSSTAFAQSN
jgi:hypothetical protein